MDELAVLAHQGGIGTMAVYLLQWLKNTGWFPWVSNNSAQLNRWIGIIIAVSTSVILKYSFTPTPDGGYHIAFDIPNLDVVFDTVTHAFAQFAGQQILYHTAVKDTIGGMRTKETASGGTVSGAVIQVASGEEKQ